MSKRILVVWKGQYPWDVRIQKLCQALIESGSELMLLCRWNGEAEEREIVDNIPVRRAGFQKHSALTLPIPINPYWKSLIEDSAKEINADIIITREIMIAVQSAKVARKLNIPSITDMAENYPAGMKEWKKYKKNIFIKLAVHNLELPVLTEKRAVDASDGIITVCSENSDRLVNIYKFNKDNIVEVHNTPSVKSFDSNNQSRSFNPNNLVFGHHGHLTEEKKIDIFLKGFLLFVNDYPNSKFTIAGAGESLDQLKEITEESQNKHSVEFLGTYKPQNLEAILKTFDIGVMPYQINDFNNFTIHNKIFDYFANAIPVIGSEAVPIKRVLTETSAGLSIDCTTPEIISNSLNEFVKLNLKDMAANAHKAFIDKYNWENDSNKLTDFINKF
ncbi:MAG: glycosyltransferase [Candidatus Kapabacteria bacterium]|nr:glycosyltransferase [Candidatus Kapabacteria bacterium]